MTTYFGDPWNPNIAQGTQIDVPIGECCAWCHEEFVWDDQGMAIPGLRLKEGTEEYVGSMIYYHLNCFLRTVLGSLGHQRKQCSCFGGNAEDPPGMTPREAADAAVREFEEGSRRR